jgi:putative SOS response-associated peptidase YedK
VCGRYVSAGDLADLSVLMGANPFAADADPRPDAADREKTTRERRFGLAPTDPVPAVLPGQEPGTRQLTLLSWGLVPPWADPSTGSRRINARVETVLEKASFRRAVRARRALLPADGWYEWVREADPQVPRGIRRPHLVRPADGGLLAFAGLFERWHAPDGSVLQTGTILTGPAPAELAWLHERAPIAVPAELWGDWLDPESDVEALLDALAGTTPRPMVVVRVAPMVNNVRNTGPALVEATGAPVVGPPTAPPSATPGPVEAPLPLEQAALW